MRRSRSRPPSTLISAKERRWLFMLGVSLVLCFSILYGVYRSQPVDDTPNAPRVVERTEEDRNEDQAGDREPFNPLNLKEVHRCDEVDRDLLANVEDDTKASFDDNPAIFQMLCVASTTPPDLLARRSRRDVSLTNLHRQPNHYRGELIHIEGVLARLERIEAVESLNDYGISEYYEAWIFPGDQNRVACVVNFTQLPPGLVPATQMNNETVSIDAFFFKWLVYVNKEEARRRAAQFVGGRLNWQPPVETTGSWTEALLFGGVFLTIIVVASAWMILASLRDTRTASKIRERAAEPLDTKPPLFSDTDLANEPPPEPPAAPPSARPEEWLRNE